MLVLFHVQSSEADGVLCAFGIEPARKSKDRKQTGCRDYLALVFRNFWSPGFKTLNSAGVWAKNSARDITGKDA